MENEVLAERIKEHRKIKGLSQEQLAQDSGLNLRTIQRIENGETVPRGDSLRRLAVALNTSPDELIDWQTKDDKNVLMIMVLSQLSFIAFPLLGVLIPLTIWILQKEKIKKVDQLGKSILNFQLSWVLLLFILFGVTIFGKLMLYSWSSLMLIMLLLYGYNFILIVVNAVLVMQEKNFFYKPALRILR